MKECTSLFISVYMNILTKYYIIEDATVSLGFQSTVFTVVHNKILYCYTFVVCFYFSRLRMCSCFMLDIKSNYALLNDNKETYNILWEIM